ncbi:MAG: hypothetical protein QOJ64_1873 [Acidobacteriota bacterium]|jgi:ubiquinone/menaquinone biosynthesis C-methylase UbiE|nr:hypothetical protein [Acidobacteriota bacterium]
MNFFDSKSAAGRYSSARPFFHPAMIDRIKTFLALDEPVARALDVGCGTGLSTVALSAIAKRVIGVDSAMEMISLATRNDAIDYVVASAHSLPVTSAGFDLMTLSQAFHWLDRDVFLEEARRVLRPGGSLVVYDSYFVGRMKENEGFEVWFRPNYPKRFPPPWRTELSFSDDDSGNSGFKLLRHDRFAYDWRLSLTQLVDYLLTHSNVIAVVEYGDQDLDAVRSWLSENIRPFFDNRDHSEFVFDGVIWYLQRPG